MMVVTLAGMRGRSRDDLLVVAVARAGAVVAGMDDAAVLALQLLEPDRIEHRAAGVEQDGRRHRRSIWGIAAAKEPAEAGGLLHVPAHAMKTRARVSATRLFKPDGLSYCQTNHRFPPNASRSSAYNDDEFEQLGDMLFFAEQ